MLSLALEAAFVVVIACFFQWRLNQAYAEGFRRGVELATRSRRGEEREP